MPTLEGLLPILPRLEFGKVGEFLMKRNQKIIVVIVLVFLVFIISTSFEQKQELKGEISHNTFEIEKEYSIQGPIIKEKLPSGSENITVNVKIKSIYGKDFSTRILTAEEKRQILLFGGWIYYVPSSRRGKGENNYHLTFKVTKDNLKKGYFLETTHRRLGGRDIVESKVFCVYKRKLSLGQTVISRFTNGIPTRFHTFLTLLTILGFTLGVLFRFGF